ncbi:MAG: MopE-related protein [Persicimonas sp.]
MSFAVGCGGDTTADEQECPDGERENSVTGECEPRDDSNDSNDSNDSSPDASSNNQRGDASDAGDSGDQQPPSDAGRDAEGSDGGENDGGENDDAGSREDGGSECPDRDDDGYRDEDCGGRDCDDSDPRVFPGATEICDGRDNDCDGEANNGIECTFYAHSASELYEVDPFEKTADYVTDVPDLVDIDTHPDGTLYGISFDTLFSYDESADEWTEIGDHQASGTTNGLAIDNDGTLYATSGNTLYTIDEETGDSTEVGQMGGSYSSSGDCVINKDNSLYMSSNHNLNEDTLVLIDAETGDANSVGDISYSSVYGLTAAWGRMYGLTGSGELIEIDQSNGEGELIHTFSDITFNGAASTPNR